MPCTPTPGDVYGVISLVFWSITIVVSVKYLTFIMRADDHGQGGVMSLTSLLSGARRSGSAAVPAVLITLGIIGAALFYGDGAITPAISVLSAVGGLKVAVPSLASIVLPVAVAILCLLFAIQRFGTGTVGNLFGPVMAVWFGTLGVVGVVEVAQHPGILRGLSPSYAVEFFVAPRQRGVHRARVGGAGGDGRRGALRGHGSLRAPPDPARVVPGRLPGADAQLPRPGRADPAPAERRLQPLLPAAAAWAQIPMVFLATAATVIASQAVISGAFSVTQQAVQLGFLPRLVIRHTSERQIWQIYAPAINVALFGTVLAIAIGFGSSARLASAYGVAVTGTFIIDTILFLAVARLLWHKSKRLIALGAAVFLTFDVAFFAANVTKVARGGWLPLTIALIVFTLVITWYHGRRIVDANRERTEGLLADFIEQIGGPVLPVRQVSGVGVFLSPNLRGAPLALRANVEHNQVLHDHVIIVAVKTEYVPRSTTGSESCRERRSSTAARPAIRFIPWPRASPR